MRRPYRRISNAFIDTSVCRYQRILLERFEQCVQRWNRLARRRLLSRETFYLRGFRRTFELHRIDQSGHPAITDHNVDKDNDLNPLRQNAAISTGRPKVASTKQ